MRESRSRSLGSRREPRHPGILGPRGPLPPQPPGPPDRRGARGRVEARGPRRPAGGRRYSSALPGSRPVPGRGLVRSSGGARGRASLLDPRPRPQAGISAGDWYLSLDLRSFVSRKVAGPGRRGACSSSTAAPASTAPRTCASSTPTARGRRAPRSSSGSAAARPRASGAPSTSPPRRRPTSSLGYGGYTGLGLHLVERGGRGRGLARPFEDEFPGAEPDRRVSAVAARVLDRSRPLAPTEPRRGAPAGGRRVGLVVELPGDGGASGAPRGPLGRRPAADHGLEHPRYSIYLACTAGCPLQPLPLRGRRPAGGPGPDRRGRGDPALVAGDRPLPDGAAGDAGG